MIIVSGRKLWGDARLAMVAACLCLAVSLFCVMAIMSETLEEPPPQDPMMTMMRMDQQDSAEGLLWREELLQRHQAEEEGPDMESVAASRGMVQEEEGQDDTGGEDETVGDELGDGSSEDTSDTTGSHDGVGEVAHLVLKEDTSKINHPSKPLLVHKGDIQLLATEAKHIPTTEHNITTFAQNHGGYLEQRQIDRPSDPKPWRENDSENGGFSVDLRLRIPSDKFEAFIAYIRSMEDIIDTVVFEEGERGVRSRRISILSLSTSTEDVTLRFVDAQARADTLEQSRTALSTLLKHTHKTKEVLEITQELNQLTQQAEAQRQQALYLKNQASMSKVHITIRPNYNQYDEPPERPWWWIDWDPLYTLDIAFGGLMNLLMEILDGLIYVIVWTFPLCCCLACCTRFVSWDTVRASTVHVARQWTSSSGGSVERRSETSATYNTMPLNRNNSAASSSGNKANVV